MTPPPLSSEFQFPFKKGCIIRENPKGLRGNLSKLEERDEEDGESDDPGLHPEWQTKLKEIDPEGYESLKETFPKWYAKLKESESTTECRKAAWSRQWLHEIS